MFKARFKDKQSEEQQDEGLEKQRITFVTTVVEFFKTSVNNAVRSQ